MKGKYNMKRINWKNVIKLICLQICLVVVIQFLKTLLFSTNCLTWFGLITFILFLGASLYLVNDFSKQIKDTPCKPTKHTKGIHQNK